MTVFYTRYEQQNLVLYVFLYTLLSYVEINLLCEIRKMAVIAILNK